MYRVCLLLVVMAALVPSVYVHAEDSVKLDQIVQNGVTISEPPRRCLANDVETLFDLSNPASQAGFFYFPPPV